MLVSTHYMDEAERCHRIVYIAYGTIVARGTAEEIIEDSGPRHLRRRRARGSAARREALRGMPGVEQVAAFGEDLHVVGSDRAALERSVAESQSRFTVESAPGETTPRGRLHPPDERSRGDGRRMMTHSLLARARIRAVLLKEVIQMRRDRLTFAMIVGIPIIQLVLFGYAINTDPKRLADRHRHGRRSAAGRARHRRRHADLRLFPHRRQRARRRRRGEKPAARRRRSPSSSPFPPVSQRDLVRGERPQIVVEADATDPSASANAIGASAEIVRRAVRATNSSGPIGAARRGGRGRGRGPPPLQSGGHHAIQHRAGPDRHDPHHDDDADDGAGADPRGRARHDGESAGHAGRGRSRS